jgi:hypothetical protein
VLDISNTKSKHFGIHNNMFIELASSK